MQTNLVPDDFPRDGSNGVVAGAQPKICVVLSDGKYIAGQTDAERKERWDICEDLAHQLMPKAQKDAAAHPEHSRDVTLERVRVAVARKNWVSSPELSWLISRLRALLNW
ncbi:MULTISPECIES: hypothetical protein [unclassified Paraburkholderia]|uniref:hypothetical protein n=1 Tax=unclassified Paraburkholderia TaxID=2615204 RepID=UPI002AB30D52|nr:MULTISPECIES: hypothetical protein [unclassified Paraburkholderia]